MEEGAVVRPTLLFWQIEDYPKGEGHDEHIRSRQNSNILGVVELIREFEPCLAKHLDEFSEKGLFSQVLGSEYKQTTQFVTIGILRGWLSFGEGGSQHTVLPAPLP